MLHLNEPFDRLIASVQKCDACPSMQGCTRVLSWANGAPGSQVMFVGEAPGRLGADRTAVPFHGDVAGDNFERLLALAGLSRGQVFITNAVLCNPKDSKGNNAPPSRRTLVNCAKNLRRQIEVIQPTTVITLGAAALEATRVVEHHDLRLAENVRTVHQWNGVNLIPLYHPGARAMIHRNFATQSADYYFVGEFVRRHSAKSARMRAPSRKIEERWNLVRYIVQKAESISLFRLHKFFYLLDCRSLISNGRPLTNFVYIRQKDGPYCVELGSRWFSRHQDQINFSFRNSIPFVSWINNDLFSEPLEIDSGEQEQIDRLLTEIDGLTDSQLKARAYLTPPMKEALRAERRGVRQLNKPLL